MVSKVLVTMSPHNQKGEPTGYYLIGQRMFERQVKLDKCQFAGYCDGLVVTVGGIEHTGWNSVLAMAINLPTLGGRPVNWICPVKQYVCAGGIRVYVPGRSILMPRSAEETCTRLWGEFERCSVGDTFLYFLRVPLLNGDVLLGRRSIKDVEQRS